MLVAIVAAALRARVIVIFSVIILAFGSVLATNELDVEAYPNPIPPMIEVIAQPPGLGAEEVEKYVTVPLEVALAGIPNLEHVRSQSLFGLSDVKCYFRWGTDYVSARQEVINRLSFVTLPSNVQAELSPWNAIGEIYRYTLEGKGYSLRELKTAQDFVMERQLRQVPGVADVTSFGGETRQYHVIVDPLRLRSVNVSLNQVLAAIQNANQSVGGQRIAIGAQSYDVRGVGLMRDVADIGSVVIATPPSSAPIRLRDVGSVEIGPAPRLGVVGIQERSDVVQGIVLMRWDATTRETLQGVRERIKRIQDDRLLPPGMEIRPYYDRGDLVSVTTHTVAENLFVGMVLVAAVLFVFLGNVRAAMISAAIVPLSLGCAIVGLVMSHTSANLLSIGAIDFGIVVDSTVVMMEGICRKLEAGPRGAVGSNATVERILGAVREVGTPMVFSTFIIAVSFLPLFTMTGVTGVIFAPMAKTYAFAIGGAIVLALTIAPVLASYSLRAHDEGGARTGLAMRLAHRMYAPIFRLGLDRPRWALAAVLVPIALAIAITPRLGGELMPTLEEGNLYIRATLPISISREEAAIYADSMRAIVRGCPCEEGAVRKHPEVLVAVSQVGRPDDGTDVTGFNDIEIFAPLADLHSRHMKTKSEIVNELDHELSTAFPNVVFAFSQMISDNVEEAVAGVKGANSVKVFGSDLENDEKTALAITKLLTRVRGVDDLGMYASLGQPTIRITPDREAAGRYGVNSGDVVAMVQAAIGGQVATHIYEGDKVFDLTVRWPEKERSSIAAIEGALVAVPDGSQVPVSELARVERVAGVATIYREDGERYVPVKFSVRGRDLASTIHEAQSVVRGHIRLPWGSRMVWAGELGELERAERRLAVMLPVTLGVILMIAFVAVKSLRGVLLVVANVPVAAAGGLLALFATGTTLSVAAAMGFVSVLGIAVQDAILVMSAFQHHRADGMSSHSSAEAALDQRLRPVLMTTLVAMLGLLPTAVSRSIGAETQRPLAIFVIGGALMMLFGSRLLQAALLVLLHPEEQPARSLSDGSTQLVTLTPRSS